MKLLTFAASNSKTSINKHLVQYATRLLTTELGLTADVTLLDLNDFEMPIYRPDREADDGIPQLAHQFSEHITAADAIIISFAEHNGTVTAAWKNIFDWISRIDKNVWQNKPMVLLAASPGPRAGQGVLQSQIGALPFFAGDLKASVGVGNWHQVWDEDHKTLTSVADIDALRTALQSLVAA